MKVPLRNFRFKQCVREKRETEFWTENSEGRDLLLKVGVDKRIILK